MFRREDRDDHVLVTMAHGKANVLDTEFLLGLSETLEILERDSVPAVVLTGQGRIFSAGVDLVRVAEGGASYLESFLPALDEALGRLFRFNRPLVAAINGHAIAGGCIIALAADAKILATGGGRMGVPELSVGVPFPATALEIVRFSITPRALQTVVYGGGTYDAETALAFGFADELCSPEELLERAIARARSLAAIPRVSFELTKSELRAHAGRLMADEKARLGASVRRAWASPPVLEALRAYVARTLGK
ncbi:MAG: enoyl-CoA hydratase/isomerase family protein [Planctomycetota bacterium]